jgi:hypothetical protein
MAPRRSVVSKKLAATMAEHIIRDIADGLIT